MTGRRWTAILTLIVLALLAIGPAVADEKDDLQRLDVVAERPPWLEPAALNAARVVVVRHAMHVGSEPGQQAGGCGLGPGGSL